jgi:hypothetical protein
MMLGRGLWFSGMSHCVGDTSRNAPLHSCNILEDHSPYCQWCANIGSCKLGRLEYINVCVCIMWLFWLWGWDSFIHSFIHYTGTCRMRRFLAIHRSFFHSSLLYTFSCHSSPQTILSSSLTSSCHLFLGLPLSLISSTLFGWDYCLKIKRV